ncbi:hypothetical protein HK405_013194, partial [Cladochytrium tenue]
CMRQQQQQRGSTPFTPTVPLSFGAQALLAFHHAQCLAYLEALRRAGRTYISEDEPGADDDDDDVVDTVDDREQGGGTAALLPVYARCWCGGGDGVNNGDESETRRSAPDSEDFFGGDGGGNGGACCYADAVRTLARAVGVTQALTQRDAATGATVLHHAAAEVRDADAARSLLVWARAAWARAGAAPVRAVATPAAAATGPVVGSEAGTGGVGGTNDDGDDGEDEKEAVADADDEADEARFYAPLLAVRVRFPTGGDDEYSSPAVNSSSTNELAWRSLTGRTALDVAASAGNAAFAAALVEVFSASPFRGGGGGCSAFEWAAERGVA